VRPRPVVAATQSPAYTADRPHLDGVEQPLHASQLVHHGGRERVTQQLIQFFGALAPPTHTGRPNADSIAGSGND
jgi:hypothetical protein